MKRVYIKSFGPLAMSKTIEIGWEDVWLRLHSGRRSLSLAPCLVSRENLKSDIALTKRMLESRSKYHETYEQDLKREQEILAGVDAAGFFVDQRPRTTVKGEDPGHRFSLANVYTRRDWINREEAERMLDFYLAQIGIRNCVHKWKVPRFCIYPVTLGQPS